MEQDRIYYQTYDEMYINQFDEIIRYVRRSVRNNEMAVEDLTQEVFLVAYLQWETKVRNHENIPGYLKKVARNKILKWFEQQSGFYLDAPEMMEWESYVSETSGKPDAYQMVEFFTVAEQILPAMDLYMLRGYYEYGYKASELSTAWGITESSFKMRIARMKEKLKKSMKFLVFMPFIVTLMTSRF